MKPFRYGRAEDERGAVAMLAATPGAKFLGGGTNLVDLMRLGVETPDVLVDISRLPYDRIDATADGGLRIGAGVRNSDLAADRRVRTRNLAVIGHSPHCVATHPSDMAVAMAAFDATVRVVGPAGAREIPLVDFHRLPGDTPERDTMLGADELIVAVDLPALAVAANSAYRKVRERASFAFALVSVAAALDVVDGEVRDVRIAFGGLAHKPWRAHAAEAALRGAEADAAAFARAADAELRQAEPLRDNAYKVELARRTLVRTLEELAG